MGMPTKQPSTMDSFDYDEPMHGVCAISRKRNHPLAERYEWESTLDDEDLAMEQCPRISKRRRVLADASFANDEAQAAALVVFGNRQTVAHGDHIVRCVPRSLAFALPTLSSAETRAIFGELASVREELSWLDGTQPSTDVHSVFGWRSAFWAVPSSHSDSSIAVKSAKAFEAVPMRHIARRVWSRFDSQDPVDIKNIYSVTNDIRIVRPQVQDCSGRLPHLWLECMIVRGNTTMYVRKELHHFKNLRQSDRTKRDRECHGYMLREMFVPIDGQIVGGTVVQSMSKLRKTRTGIKTQIASMVEDLPLFLLGWEEAFVHDRAAEHFQLFEP